MAVALRALADSASELMEHVLPHYFGVDASKPAPLFAWSNHIIAMLAVAGLLIIIFTTVGARARKTLIPRGMHNLFESVLSFLRTELIRPALKENADRFTPFIWTVFFFILFCNLLGLFPVNEVFELATHGRVGHVWGTATANFSVTGALAIMAFVMIHVSGIAQQVRIKMNPSLDPHHHGHGHDEAHTLEHGEPLPVALVTGTFSYIWNFAPHPEIGWKVLDFGMWAALLVLEIMGAAVKPTSLCVRLFANMLAGHLVLAALVGMIPFASALTHLPEPAYKWGPISIVVIAGCTALSLLELFVAFLQAYIFTFLTTLFIASAVAPEH